MMWDRLGLKGRVALITGGSRGLGRVMARGLAEAGAHIAICSRNEAELEASLAEILADTGIEGRCFVADLAERSQTEKLATSVLDHFQRVDILVNNAGINLPQSIDTVSNESWDRTLELNLTSAMVLTRALVPQMKARRWGRIIHISSIMGIASKAGRNSYSATKSALIGLMKANALDLGPFNVTVNCIAPGFFLTDLPKTTLTEEERKIAADRTALDRWGQPEELVGPALFLAGEWGSYITGSVLVVDGGLLCKTF